MKIHRLDEVLGETEDGEIYICDHILEDDEGRRRVVGSIYRPVSAQEYADATSDEGLQQNLARWWNDARRRGDDRGIGEYAGALFAEKGAGAIWDTGDPAKAAMAREYAGISEADAPIFTCCGGGTCIDQHISWSKVSSPEKLFLVIDIATGMDVL